MVCRFCIGLMLAAALSPTWAGEGATLEALLKRPQYESLSLSPRGDYLAAQVPLDDRTVLAIVRRSDMKITAQIDPGDEGFVESSFWVSDTRLFAATSKRFGTLAEPYSLPYLYSVDVDGRNRRGFGAGVVDPLLDDPDFLLVSECHQRTLKGCLMRVGKLRKDGLGKMKEVVDAPLPDAAFVSDRLGNVRFSWSTDDNDIQRLFARKDGRWILLNDEGTSGVEAWPVGVDYRGTRGYLFAQRRSGSSVIEQVDLKTLQRDVVAEHASLDPGTMTTSFDGHEPIGATFGEGLPTTTFFDASHPHATLTRELEASFPGEFARVTSASRNGATALVTVSSDREPGRFYLLDTASGDLSLLARSRPWLEPRALAAAEPVTLRARDGLLLRGYFTRPVVAGAGPAPLVVLVHGGPFEARDAWLFDDEVQMLAARGYAVLRLNFRGSGGYGRAFVEAGYRQWGLAMQDDLTDATHWAVAERGVDARRICLWGASYGGYAAVMGVVREPDLYRCAVGMAGPYDLSTLYKWGDTRRTRWGKAWLATSLGVDPAALLAASPTRHAGVIKARLMLVQGGRDPRVSAQHFLAMKRALDAAGKPYEQYLAKSETHGFHREATRREYYQRVLDFIDRNIGAAAAP